MELKYNILFYLKKPKNYATGNIPVYMRFTVARVSKECATTRTADPEKWCSKTNRESGKSETSKSLNFHLDELQRKVDEAHAQLVKARKAITAEALRDKFLGRDRTQKVPRKRKPDTFTMPGFILDKQRGLHLHLMVHHAFFHGHGFHFAVHHHALAVF